MLACRHADIHPMRAHGCLDPALSGWGRDKTRCPVVVVLVELHLARVWRFPG